MIVILKVEKELPSLGLSLLPIVLLIVLIFIKAVVHLFVKDVPSIGKYTVSNRFIPWSPCYCFSIKRDNLFTHYYQKPIKYDCTSSSKKVLKQLVLSY